MKNETKGATLMMHAGGFTATEEQVAAVAVPERTATYTPIPHIAVVEQLRSRLPKFEMKIERLQYGLANDGQRMFGVCDVVNGIGAPDWGISIGFRNSYNKSMSLGLCAGSRVFVCDNLAMHSEVVLRERHVGKLDVELPELVSELITRTVGFKERVAGRINRLKQYQLTDAGAHDVICRAVLRDALPATHVPKVLGQWYEPKHEDFAPRTAWSLFNGFTEVVKERSAGLQMKSTLQLTDLFDEIAAARN